MLKAALGMPIIHTLECHKSDLADRLDNKFTRGELPEILRIGEELDLGRILVRGSCENNLTWVAPEPGEFLIFKSGKGAFYKTHFDNLLQSLDDGCRCHHSGVYAEYCVGGNRQGIRAPHHH